MHRISCGAMALLIVMAGCSSKTDATEQNFSAAVGQYLDKKGELCLGLSKWPVDVSAHDFRMQAMIPTNNAMRMAALETVGLTVGEDAELQQVGWDGKPMASKTTVKRYVLSDAAKPFERRAEVDGIAGKSTLTDLCWGKKALDKVTKWEGPMKFGDYQEARVMYQYKIHKVADWATKPVMLAAFPAIKMSNDRAGKDERHTVKLTSSGWEPMGLDN